MPVNQGKETFRLARPPIFATGVSPASATQPKPATMAVESRIPPPVYRCPTATSRLAQRTVPVSSALETRSAPPIYRPAFGTPPNGKSGTMSSPIRFAQPLGQRMPAAPVQRHAIPSLARPGIAVRTVQRMELASGGDHDPPFIPEGETEKKVTKVDRNQPIPLRLGLIHGTYKPADNSADLHVSDKGGGGGMNPRHMRTMAGLVYSLMKDREHESGIKGRLELKPTGTAVVKMVVELLGEALGSTFSVLEARFHKKWRKNFGSSSTQDRSRKKLESGVLSEHISSLKSLQGEGALTMIPLIQTQNQAYKAQSTADYYQDMLEATPQGEKQFERYVAQVSDPHEQYSPGLFLTISADQIPALIAVLDKIING
jgi:hypothetical protein